MGEHTYLRVDLAKEQLDMALDLFLGRSSMVSALTLAGAAEEVLGRALQHQGKTTALEEEYTVMGPFETHLRKAFSLAGGPYTWRQFSDEKNRARNAAKHLRDGTETTITCDLEDEALWMIVRAVDNYSRLGFDQTTRMRDFDEWFYANIVGEH